jgi:hypothetical protein
MLQVTTLGRSALVRGGDLVLGWLWLGRVRTFYREPWLLAETVYRICRPFILDLALLQVSGSCALERTRTSDTRFRNRGVSPVRMCP